MLKNILLVCLLFPFLLGSGSVGAAEMGKRPQEPIHIEADRMVSNQQEKAVAFSGRVEAKQGDLLIHGDEMVVYHGGKDKNTAGPASKEVTVAGGSAQIERIKINGHVEIIRQGLVATGDHAEYRARTGEVTITGHAKILQDNNMVTGHSIIIDMERGTTEIEPGAESGGRVVGYFYPTPPKEKKAQGDHGDTGSK